MSLIFSAVRAPPWWSVHKGRILRSMPERPKAADAEPKLIRVRNGIGRAFVAMNSSITPPYIIRCADTGQFIFNQRIANAASVWRFRGHTQRTDNLLRFGFHFTAEIQKTTSVPSREQNRSSQALCRTNARCLQMLVTNFRHETVCIFFCIPSLQLSIAAMV